MSERARLSSEFSDSLPPKELLAYYKSRVGENTKELFKQAPVYNLLESFEEERKGLLQKVDALHVEQTELHRLEWENKQRTSEIWELQKTISSANNELFEERGRLLKLQSENDTLKLQEDENQKKIKYLLSLTHACEQEVTYLRDESPAVLNKSYNIENANHKQSNPENMLRTVYLPTANADSLLLKVQTLQTQLNEQRHFASERAAAFVQDRNRMEESFSNHRLNYEQRIEALGHKVQRVEEMLRNCTRDYIITRRAKQELEERAVAAESELAQLKQTTASRIQELKNTAASQLQKIKKTTQDTVDECCEKFHHQILEKEKEVYSFEQLLHATKNEYEARIAELEEKANKTQSKNKQLESRRLLDKEGFVNEISLLRKKLEVVDRRLHQMRLVERLGEDDRLDRMLHSLENKMPNVGWEGEYLKTCSMSEVTSEIHKIQNSLTGIELKIANNH